MTSLEVEQKFVAQTYRAISSQFDKTRYKIWSTTKDQILFLHDLLALDTKETLKILELGCGNGRNLRAIKQLINAAKLEIVAVEPCPELSKINQDNDQFDQVINCGHFSDQLEQFKESIDLVLSVAVIHHLSNDERRINAIRELVTLTKLGGYIIIQVMALHKDRAMVGWTELGQQDFLIPWVRTGDMRYYHLFEKGDLEHLISTLNNVEIIRSFEDRSNYGVVLQKIN